MSNKLAKLQEEVIKKKKRKDKKTEEETTEEVEVEDDDEEEYCELPQVKVSKKKVIHSKESRSKRKQTKT